MAASRSASLYWKAAARASVRYRSENRVFTGLAAYEPFLEVTLGRDRPRVCRAGSLSERFTRGEAGGRTVNVARRVRAEVLADAAQAICARRSIYPLTIYPLRLYSGRMKDLPDPASFLPLPAATFHILMSVAEDDRHGYAIIQDVMARTGGELKLSAGTLYRSIQRMLEQGLVMETRERPEDDDERRRYYRITPFGRTVARAEARRLTQLVKMARQSGFARA